MRRVLGIVLLAVATLLFLVGVLDLIDPVGTKLADDADPLGVPAPWYVAAGLITASVLCAATGVWLLRRQPGTLGARAT